MDKAKVLILGNDPNNTPLKTIYCDFQEYELTIKIGDYNFNVTKRIFTDYIEPLIDIEGYLKIQNFIYKILNVKSDSDYQELWLYLLNRQSEVV